MSSEREIVDSIVVIKNKADRREEKAARKARKRKEKRESASECTQDYSGRAHHHYARESENKEFTSEPRPPPPGSIQ